MKGVSQRVADQQKGGFMIDVDIEITDALYKRDSFEVEKDGVKETVTRTVAALEVLMGDSDEPVTKTYALGDALRPSEDGETESDEGPFLVPAEGKSVKGVSAESAWGKFQAALAVKCKFPDELWDMGCRKALSGLKGHTTGVPGGKYKGQQGADVPVLASIDADTIPKKGKASAKAAPATTKKGAKASEPEPEEEDENSVEARVKAIIAKKAAKEATTKAQLSTLMNKKFTDKAELREAVALCINDKWIKKGAAEGLWSYDGRQVSAVEAEEAEEENDDE